MELKSENDVVVLYTSSGFIYKSKNPFPIKKFTEELKLKNLFF